MHWFLRLNNLMTPFHFVEFSPTLYSWLIKFGWIIYCYQFMYWENILYAMNCVVITEDSMNKRSNRWNNWNYIVCHFGKRYQTIAICFHIIFLKFIILFRAQVFMRPRTIFNVSPHGSEYLSWFAKRKRWRGKDDCFIPANYNTI